ncbi:DUF3800 domain-containing protein [Mahella australiensis]|uniref:DUF3800 domain-containing protein n=1 Tax=Mahella australiensis (strain DSM 15567 / CIP 107919 / 50-1 BON) TaxID=697281 RepID=F3ZVV1_MAHA5|nr:DUF3800 domain-containing protein [Mahella australiensis]AEE95325.1 hypothetical protein Mahau_0102 [Mahella australiensis 50-1 BON]
MQTKLPLVHVYCDESSQSCNKYLVIGGIWIPAENVGNIGAKFIEFRNNNHMLNELKWGKVSNGKLNEYKKFIDEVFDGIYKRYLAYRCIIVNMEQYDNKTYNNGDKELGFYKIYYQLLLQNCMPGHRYIIYPDDRKNSYKHRLEALKIILNRGMRKKYGINYDAIRNIEARDSHNEDLIQAVDIITGAIGYRWNCRHLNDNASTAKIQLSEYITQKAGLQTLATCHKKGEHVDFNIWYMDMSKSNKRKTK